MANKTEETYEIDILQLAKALLGKWWIIAISAILCAAVFLAYSIFFIVPSYSSSVLFYVNNTSISLGSASVSISNGDLTAAKTLVDTYCVILKTRLTLEEVSDSLTEKGLDYSYEKLDKIISHNTVNNTEIFRVTVQDPDPKNACTIANTIAQILPQKISDVVDGSSVKVVDYAVVPTVRTSPSYSKNTAIGFIIGALAACVCIAVTYLVNDTIDTEEWLLNTFKDEIPLLSVIPDNELSGGRKYKKYGYKSHYYRSYGYYTSDKGSDADN